MIKVISYTIPYYELDDNAYTIRQAEEEINVGQIIDNEIAMPASKRNYFNVGEWYSTMKLHYLSKIESDTEIPHPLFHELCRYNDVIRYAIF